MNYIDIKEARQVYCPFSMASDVKYQPRSCYVTGCLAWQKQPLTTVEVFSKGSRFEYPITKIVGYSETHGRCGLIKNGD